MRFREQVGNLFGGSAGRRASSRRAEDSQPARTFAVTAVCTGNICRSAYLQHALAAASGRPERFASAGVGALVGAPLDPAMAQRFRDRWGEPPEHRARALDARTAEASALLLVMTREHRRWVARYCPEAFPRTFLLHEFLSIVSRLPDDADDGTLDGLVAAAHRHRPWGADAPEVEDPYRRGTEVASRVAAELDDAVVEISAVLEGRAVSGFGA